MNNTSCGQTGGALFTTVTVLSCLMLSQELRADDNPPKKTAAFTFEIQRSVLSHTFVGQGGIRYFASEVAVTNRSTTDIIVSLADVKLLVDGQEFTNDVSPSSLNGYALQVGDESIRFRDLQQQQHLELKEGETKSTWLVFTKLPTLSTVPQMVLQVKYQEAFKQIDVNQHHALRLQLTHQRIGPGRALGLVRIGGALDTVNVGTLASLTDELASRGVSRIVISFADTVAPMSGQLRGWVQQIAEDNGTARQYSQFPAIAPSIREVHVAALPGHSVGSSSQQNNRPFLHQSEALAVEWALEPVLQNLSANQVAEQIQDGDRLVRAAALATAADHLSDEHLPMIIELTASDDPVLQRAAFLALCEFNQPSAVDVLVQHARSTNPRLAPLAVECLAASRFEAAHQALAELLDDNLAVTPADLSRILAMYPRERWITALTKFATGDFLRSQLSQEEVADVRRDALLALGRIGHPQLVDLLEEALEADAAPVRETAFSLLIAQQDKRSNQLAMDAALARIESEYPSHQILMLLERLPDARAVPLLVNHLENANQNRSNVIKTLARIGGAGIDRTLAEHFSSLKAREQAAVLNELTELASDQAVTLAGEAIQSEETILFNAAIGVLQLQESPEAVEFLLQALVETTTSRNVRVLTRALSEIGTTEAINALRQARTLANDDEKLRQIVQILVNMEKRSPGYPALDKAKDHAEHEDWAQAIDDYDVALEIDPELISAYSGRGHCLLQLERLDKAGEDFRAALKRNPFDGMSVTGLGIILARQGDPDAGIQLVEEAVERFPNDWVFSYNSACVYGRALEAALTEEPSQERDQRIGELQSQAIKKLELSAEQGLPEFEYMRRDPDLKPLWELPDFQQLKAPGGADSDS